MSSALPQIEEGDQSSRPGRAGRIARIAASVVLAAAVPAAVLLAGSASYEPTRYGAPLNGTQADAAVAAASPPTHDPGKRTAVVVVGGRGANVADVLVPYDLLSSTGRFNVYVVAPQRGPLPLLGGLDVVPDLTFTELADRLGAAGPDVTVVPDMPTDPATDAAVAGWLRDTASRGLVLGVCSGARLVADAGLLDGRPATSHWFRLGGIEAAHPRVNWQRGVRYIDDGTVITTGGLLSSVDGTLRVIERLAGPDAAAQAANAAGWRHYLPGRAAALPRSGVSPVDGVVHLLNTGLRAPATGTGILIGDGVGELALAAAFDPDPEVKSSSTFAVSLSGKAVRSRHGLTFVPRGRLDTAEGLDHLVVPAGGPEAGRTGVAVTRLDGTGFAFDRALTGLAGRTDVATARWAAEILEYPPDDLVLDGAAWPWLPTLAVLALAAVGPTGVWVASRLARNRRRSAGEH
jgi:putative intracellular protease/amidase